MPILGLDWVLNSTNYIRIFYGMPLVSSNPPPTDWSARSRQVWYCSHIHNYGHCTDKVVCQQLLTGHGKVDPSPSSFAGTVRQCIVITSDVRWCFEYIKLRFWTRDLTWISSTRNLIHVTWDLLLHGPFPSIHWEASCLSRRPGSYRWQRTLWLNCWYDEEKSCEEGEEAGMCLTHGLTLLHTTCCYTADGRSVPCTLTSQVDTRWVVGLSLVSSIYSVADSSVVPLVLLEM